PTVHAHSEAWGPVRQGPAASEEGAPIPCGGKRPDRTGAFVEPTVLTDVSRDMRAFYEELFGPVAVVYSVANEDEAVALANESSYGLGGSVISDDDDRAHRVARKIVIGMEWINKTQWTELNQTIRCAKCLCVGYSICGAY